MIHSEFSFPSIDNQNIYSQEWLPETNIRGIIAIIHGLGEHSGRYQHVADFFTKNGVGLVAFDLYGHGNSGGKRGHVPSEDTCLKSIDNLLQYVKNKFPEKPIFLYGHSLGGELVLWYSLVRKPNINGVIATSPFLASYSPVNPVKLFVAKIMSKIYPSFTLDNGLNRNALSKDKSVVSAYSNDSLVHGLVSARLGWIMIEKGQWLLKHAHEFPLPLLLMIGDAESIVSLEQVNQFANLVPKNQLKYKVWKGLYHELHNEPEKKFVLEYELEWIKQHLD